MAEPSVRRTTGGAPALLWVVLALVLAACGLLVTSLVTSQTGWAWGSVGASGVAAGLLVADWMGRRSGRSTRQDRAPGDPAAAGQTSADQAAQPKVAGERPRFDVAGEPGYDQDGGEPAPTGGPTGDAALDPDTEPAEEGTDVADAIAVSDLEDEVHVIDERPRYHLAGCGWVGARETIPLPLREARELGFTPCAVCTPDFRLAARRRAPSR